MTCASDYFFKKSIFTNSFRNIRFQEKIIPINLFHNSKQIAMLLNFASGAHLNMGAQWSSLLWFKFGRECR